MTYNREDNEEQPSVTDQLEEWLYAHLYNIRDTLNELPIGTNHPTFHDIMSDLNSLDALLSDDYTITVDYHAPRKTT